jgi:5-methylcytosine-specific restriction endonuclease McrA
MPQDKKRFYSEKQAQIAAQVRRDQALRQNTYREQALALFPHVCGRCGREFSGKILRELTVHHKDSNHMNNPRDGSNWELLCLYCHDDEHGAYERAGSCGASTAHSDDEQATGFAAFEGLKDLLKPKSDDSNSEQR